MDKFLRTNFLYVQAAFFVLIGVILAAAINSLVGSFLVPFTIVLPEAVDGESAAQADQTEFYGLPPDLFGRPEPPAPAADPCEDVQCEDGQVCNPISGACELAAEPEAAQPELAEGQCIESDLALNLSGTMVSRDPAWSIAILHNPSTNRTEFASIGDTLLAEATVDSIERNRVMITRNGRPECLRTGDREARRAAQAALGITAPSQPSPVGGRLSATGATAAAATAAARPAPSGPRSVEDRIRTEITRGDDGGYNIPRDLLQEVANNESLMRRQAPEIAPYYENGQPRGLQLQNLRSDSIFAQIGIRNGDVLSAVNGSPITSPQQAASMYESLMNESSVSLTVLRRGRARTIQYNVR